MRAPPPLVARTRFGLYLPAADLHLDARSAPGTVFVSHAHSDHCSSAARILCTPETAALHDARRGARDALLLPFHQAMRVGEATVTLLPAAHALGSAMIVAEGALGTAAYTGDFKLRPNPFSPPSAVPRCDTLVMECTFGEPRYRFPPDEELYAKLFAFVDDAIEQDAVPVLLAYALGKGQEVLHHLTARGYAVVVHGAIARMCEVHERLGYGFPAPGGWTRYRKGEVADPATGRPRVLLTTPGTRKTAMVQKLPAKRVAHLTGWAYHPGAWNIYKDCDLVLPLSDHADFDELVRTATESGAQKVYTTHGPASFAQFLRGIGIDAEHIAEHPNDAGECEPERGDVPGATPDATPDATPGGAQMTLGL
jgi:Cft2 family RNA processing exonuclease